VQFSHFTSTLKLPGQFTPCFLRARNCLQTQP